MRGLSPGEARAVAAASMMTGRLQRFQTRTMRPPGTLPARCAALFASLDPAITHHASAFPWPGRPSTTSIRLRLTESAVESPGRCP
jgi:hypothetical protein